MKPKAVSVDGVGVKIVTYRQFVEIAGIFVRHDPSYQPPTSGENEYKELAPNLYWFYWPG